MESANLHHHHQLHQDHHQLLVGSSTLSTPCLSVGNSHSFPSNLLLNSSNVHTSSGEDLGCHSWINDNNSHQYLGNYIKEEIKINSESSCSLPKFTDLLNNGNLSRIQQENDNHDEEEEEEQKQMNDLSEKLLLKTLLLQSPNYHVGGPFQSMGDSPSNVPFNANVGATQIHPTVNISSLRNISSVGFPGISMMDVNLQPLDLFSMDRSSTDGSYSRLQHSLDPENLPWLNNNGARRASNIVEPKPPQSVSKRQRADSRNSCPPFKVRKEKLGDRIAALQQMVAPFGKTDTASVLMEAIGYIKFLQNQVETLSVPYMKLSSRNRSNSNTMQEGSGKAADLRSGGLCLVPLSCMSYITNDGGGGIWPPHPHNFNPGF